MKKKAIETAKDLRKQLGGTIFALPIDPDSVVMRRLKRGY